MNTQRLSTEEFIRRAKQVHGNRYDYSKVNYTNNRTKVIIICPVHGEQLQGTNAHLTTGGCKWCGVERQKRTKSHEDFLKSLPKDRDYEIIGSYEGSNKPILVRNKYSDYLISPSNLQKGVSLTLVSAINKEQFIINKFIETHGQKYDYSQVKYNYPDKNVQIICTKHGQFTQDYYIHMNGGNCLQCIFEKRSLVTDNKKLRFIEKSHEIHNNYYDYSKTEYKIDEMVIITCPIHGDFTQLPSAHLFGRGCYSCGREKIRTYLKENPTGWSLSDWIKGAEKSKNFDSFKVYVIKCWDNVEKFYKIGRTFSSISQRFFSVKMPYKYEVVLEIIGEGEEIYNLEWDLKNCNRKNRYIPQLEFGGRYECFRELDMSCFEGYKLENNRL